MDTGKLYRVNRGNASEAAGLLIRGAAVDVQILGSQLKPTATGDMVDLTVDGSITEKGAYSFTMLPEYLYFLGTADSVEIVNYSAKDLGAL